MNNRGLQWYHKSKSLRTELDDCEARAKAHAHVHRIAKHVLGNTCSIPRSGTGEAAFLGKRGGGQAKKMAHRLA